MLSLGRRENGGIRNGGERRFLSGQESTGVRSVDDLFSLLGRV